MRVWSINRPQFLKASRSSDVRMPSTTLRCRKRTASFSPVLIITGVPPVVVTVVTPELFTTKHRAVAMSVAMVSTRIGGEFFVGR